MASYSASQVEQSLRRKGFRQDERRHHRFILYYNGKKQCVNTSTSHNRQEINDQLVNYMKGQMRLSKAEFCDFVECSLTFDKYIELLKQKKCIGE